MSSIVKKTPLFQIQKNLKPRYTKFGDYTMPLFFEANKSSDLVVNIRKEAIGVFDVSHMGVIRVESKNKYESKQLIESVFPINLDKLSNYKSGLTVLLDENGYVQDDMIVSNMDNEYRIVVNSNTKYDIYNLLKKYSESNTKIKLDNNKVILAIQGKNSYKLLESITGYNSKNLYFNDNINLKIKNKNTLLEISRTGYTGEDGFELYCNIDDGKDIYNQIISLKDKHNVYFGGLLERDILRTEAGMCLSGNEFGSKMNIKFDEIKMNFLIDNYRRENGIFIGSNKLHKSNIYRTGFISDYPIKQGDIIYSQDKNVGLITSATRSFNLDKFIAIGYLEKKVDSIYIKQNKKEIKIIKNKLPFIKNKFYRK